MSVVGIDMGDESCYIAVARQGGIETLANDYSLRATPACVAFTDRNRIMGVAAKNQTTTNMRNTVSHFKHFIGKKFRDPAVQRQLSSMAYTMVETEDGGVGIRVRYQEGEHTFSPKQITAMLFTKLKLLAEAALDIKVNDVVIGVPCYFDDAGRHALLAAAQAAGLNVLRLLNETAATALAYGIYKQDLPAPEEKPRNVVFVDCGYSSLQVYAVAFNKGKLKVLATTFDDHLGGSNFDRVIADHFVETFKKQYKVDASTNKKAYLKLLTEVEKLKKQMSANSTQLPVNIECFMDDKDVSGRLSRAEFEEMAAPLFKRAEETVKACLKDSELQLEDIHSVEIVGGSSRVPAIKRIIEQVFGKSPSTTLNQDEAVARGCALQCAMLSPTFKVREFSIQDVQPYSIRLYWKDESGNNGDMEVFPKNHQVPFSKLLSFYRLNTFSLFAEYTDRGQGKDSFIGEYHIKDVTAGPDGGSQKVKVKVRVNLHGTFLVASASLTKKEEVTEEAMETEAAKEEAKDTKEEPKAAKDKEETKEPPKEGEAPPEAVKKVSRVVELPVASRGHALSPDALHALLENEGQMAAADRLECERINAKNAVEEYVYDLRAKLSEELAEYVTEEAREALMRGLTETEDWLYEEGEDCAKQVYCDKLAALRSEGEPIKERRRERMELPRAFEAYMTSVQLAGKVCQQFRAGEDKFAHLDAPEVEKVEKSVQERIAWAETQRGALNATAIHCAVPVTVAMVNAERVAFDAVVRPIITKPKPKAPTPPPTPPPAPEGEEAKEGEAPKAEEPPKEAAMDVD